MIFWLFKRCEHDFREVENYIVYDQVGGSYLKTLLYCPKCDKEKRVFADDWRRKKKMERIKKGYSSQ